ncbi:MULTISPECIES: pyruvate kinase [Salinibaculum]|uniref:pyruvate kinase n=1 Tax=Salinibaculum TaxID=2732368 RepID=UPI0030CEDE30
MNVRPNGGSDNAKIVCTLGPSSMDRGTVERLADAGMDVARLNASHGSTAQRRELIRTVRNVEDSVGRPLGVLLDIAGPEVRAVASDEGRTLQPGDSVEFTDAAPTGDQFGLTESIDAVSPGDRLLLDDGRIETTVESVRDDVVTATVDSGGDLAGRVGVNVPGVDLDLPPVTEADRAELDLAADVGVDFVAASFVRSGADVFTISAELEERDVDVPIIAKIERADAVANADSIVDAADGVMVARGDLGVECPLEDVPIIQKRLIRKCHRAGVPVITATEMLDSMIHERRPTRAEASDVANAVLDGTDAVMLSGETAVGDHPVEVVEMMHRIIADVEGSEEYDEVREQRVPPADDTRTDALARSARYLARDVGASAVVAASESGYTALKAAKYRPSIPIVAATPSADVRRQLTLSWGIIPKRVTYTTDSADALIQRAVQAAIDTGAAESGDTVVVLAGMMTELEGLDTANMLKVHIASERLAAGRSVVAGQVSGPLHPVGDGDVDALPAGVVLAVPPSFDGEFEGDLSRIGGIVDGHEGMTGYPALVARELDVPMICDAPLPDDVLDGRRVTVDGERGVVYDDPEDAER